MKKRELRKELRIHRRSVSQLMVEMDRVSTSSGGVVNLGMSSGSTSNLDEADDVGSGCLHMIDPLSPDSEYDETLAFPDDSLTLVTIGNHNPVLVQKQSRNGTEVVSSSSESDDDDTKSQIRSYNEVPYETIYSPAVKFHAYDRKIFIPATQIHVQITNYEKSMTAHLFNPILYTIQLTHGDFIWTVKKRYKDFSNLHNQLRIFRTSLNFPLPSRTHREIRSSFRNNNKISVSTISNSTMNVTSDEASRPKRKKKKGSLPRFPKRPDTLISTDQIPTRIKQLEKYLYNLLNIDLYRNHYDTVNFLEVSTFSFITALGGKGREAIVKKRTGSTNPGQKKCNFLNCFALGCCIRCNYLCSDLICGQWQPRWLILKETFLALQNPKNGLVRGVILLDNGFDISMGLYSTGLNSGLQIVTNSKFVVLKFSSKKQAKEWASHLKMIANTSARDFTSPNPFNSFAPTRPSTLSSWFVDGSSYMSAVADALEGAVEDIFIADWWLSPEIYMKRPTLDGEYWRLDKILLRKAQQGVRIFILLFKEVELALGINSFYSKQRLANLHENIKLLRHPDHVRMGTFYWAHHEKLVIIDQTYAFVGGIDLCYGRWDDHNHRLADLGSISMSNRSPSVKSYTIVENPIRSLIMQSRGIIQATASPSAEAEIQIISMTTTNNLTAIEEIPEPDPMDEHIKRDTPEMKRKGITEKIKDNMKSTGRELMNRLTFSDENDGEAAAAEAKAVIPLQVEPPTHVELDGQAKFWIGKDYTNFILKDFTELNQPFADLIDRTKTPRMPWHDIASVVVGQAGRDAARHFIERWNACKLEKARDNPHFPYLMPKSYNDIRIDHNFWQKTKVRLDRVTCQVLRSASNWSAGFIESDFYEQSIHEAYVETITKAQHYIYIENQFFISLGFPDTVVKNQIAESLFKRIARAHKEKKVFRVIIVLPLLPGFEGDVSGTTGNALRLITHWNYASICRAENSMIARLLKFGIKNPKDYISFHSLRNHAVLDTNPITELIYVHSKLMIVDDKTVIIGSANINDRSMLGKRDSEVAVIISDEAFEDGKMNGESFPCGVYAGHLRKTLFREHLGMINNDDETIDLTDPIIDSFYKDVWLKISQNNTKIFDDVFRCIPNDKIRNFLSLKKYNDEPALCKSNPDEAEEKLKGIKGFLVDLPLNFLCEEVLTPSNLSREGIVGMNVWT